MFRTFSRRFLPNPFDRILRKAAKKGAKTILLGWNRGLGDIPLGLFALVHRIVTWIPNAQVTFITRENLKEGFELLEGVNCIVDSRWKRGEKIQIDPSLKSQFDLVIENPNPTDWAYWQIGTLVPKLSWKKEFDFLAHSLDLDPKLSYVGIQPLAETDHGPWRNWPFAYWQQLIEALGQRGYFVLLFGFKNEPDFPHPNVIDFRGKTRLLELLSMIKNRLCALVLPDSGICSMTYYLNENFPLRMVSLWADPFQGILKQKVPPPNAQLVHHALIGEGRDLSKVTPAKVLQALDLPPKVFPILFAAGQGTRLGLSGPKGLFPILGKTLFEWICEKLSPGSPLAVMTSPQNHEEIVTFFQKRPFQDLELYFFQQEEAFFLDEEKKELPLKGPIGNGDVFRAFKTAGLDLVCKEKGIEWVTISYVDNPLIHPLDPELIAFSAKKRVDAVVQCIEREEKDICMGALIKEEGRIKVIEYTELDPQKQYAHSYSGQMCFSLPFFIAMADRELPIHWVRKKVGGKWIWKKEFFIFDALAFAKEAEIFPVFRKSRYAPIKGKEDVEIAIEQLKSQ